jgi:hypothetical protein
LIVRGATNINEDDSELWKICTDVPKLTAIKAALCAIMNVGLSGSGTILAGCLEKDAWNKT